jgi:hypothetical protein
MYGYTLTWSSKARIQYDWLQEAEDQIFQVA